MQYVVITIQTSADGTVASSIFKYPSIAEAISAYHSELSGGAISKALVRDVCMVVSSDGSLLYNDSVSGLAESPSEDTDPSTEQSQ